MVQFAELSSDEQTRSIFSFTEWLDLFLDCTQRALAWLTSDHYPLMLETGMEDWGPMPFKFDIAWLSEKGFLEVVREWWASISISGWMGYQLVHKLKFLKDKMKGWRKDVFGAFY